MRSIYLSLILILTLVIGYGQEISKAPSGITLEDAWKWSASESKDRGYRDVWVAYSIEKVMEEHSWIGSFRSYSSAREKTLFEYITGKKVEFDDELNAPGAWKNEARRVLDELEGTEEIRQVSKEIAFLFRYDGSPGSTENLITIRTSNIELTVDLDNVPLIWLGKRDQEESFSLLREMFDESDVKKTQKKLVGAMGIHDPGPERFAFLKDVAEGEYHIDVQESAVFWISQQETDDALAYLLRLAKESQEEEIMEKAVFGVSQFETEDATDALIDMGQNGSSENLRKKAVFWLGQRASKKALESLKGFAYEDSNVEIQRQAVFALGQIDNGGGVEEMIRIARTHPHPKIRKHAIFWLGQSEDPRAFDAIVSIAKGE